MVVNEGMSRDAWRYTQAPKPEDLKGNRYLNPPKEESPKPSSPPKWEFLRIGPLKCYSSDGKCFESYPEINIALDVVRDDATIVPAVAPVGIHKNFTLLEAISHFESQRMHLPSFALTCASIVWLYEHKHISEALAVLEQYASYGALDKTYNSHVQNTIVSGGKKLLIHYPQIVENTKVKSSNPIALPFPGDGTANRLEKALKNSETFTGLQNLTGLTDPGILLNIAASLGKEVKIYYPNTHLDLFCPILFSIECIQTNFLPNFLHLKMRSGARGVSYIGGETAYA